MIHGLGTALNTAAVVVGASTGLGLKRVIPASLQQTLRTGLGLFTAVIGIRMALKTHNELILLLSLVVGLLAGEAMHLDDGVQALGRWAESRFSRYGAPGRISVGFVTATLLFCVGPLAVLGSFLDGARGDLTLLTIKSVLDGFSSMVLAATLGVGVMLSAFSVLGFQGSLTLIAVVAHASLTDAETAELTAVGGLAVLAIALGLLELKTIKVVNLLPSLVVAPLLSGFAHALGLQ